MNDDDLARAIAALREEGERPAPQARMTRERILRDLRPRVRSRRFMVGIPLAALLLGGSVLAATGRLPEIVRAATRVLGLEKPDAPAAPGSGLARGAASAAVPPVAPAPAPENAPSSRAAAAALPPASAPGVATGADAGANRLATRRARLSAAPTNSPGSAAASDPARASDETRAGAPAGRASAAAPAGQASAAAPTPALDGPDTLALYRRAHQIHFVEQNPARALVAWDAYLASDPHGPLTVDARYDRALCLVRLGRKDEARRALEPFAAGKYGAFRKNEASQLIDALNGNAP